MSVAPSHWARVTIGEVCQLQNGRAFRPDEWSLRGLPIVRIQNLNNPGAKFNHFEGDVKEAHRISNGDLLFAWSGTPGTSFGAHIWRGGDAILNQHIFKLTFDRSLVDAEFLSYAINQTLGELALKAHGGVGLRHITKGKFEETLISLPSLAEQREIVKQITSIRLRSSRARGELKRIENLIQRYRTSILSAAFTGRLTAELHDFDGHGGGAVGKKFPASWPIRRLVEIADIQPGLAIGKKYSATDELKEVPYLRVANVQRGYLALDEVKSVRASRRDVEKLSLISGDILMNEGGDRNKLGRGWVWGGEIKTCITQNHVFRVRMHDPDFPPRFISYFANEFGQKYFFDEGTQTTNLASISKARLGGLPIPVPPIDEAREIVARIEGAFRWIQALTADVERSLMLLERLDSAVVRKAFLGELVDGNEADAPSADLVERLRASRLAREAPAPARLPPRAVEDREQVKRSMKLTRSQVGPQHLRDILVDIGGTASARDLWKRSEMEVEEFYKQLRAELKAGKLAEDADKQLVAVNAT